MKHAFTTLYKVKSEIKQEVSLFFFFVPSFGRKSLGASGRDPEAKRGRGGGGGEGSGEGGGGERGAVLIVGACTEVSHLCPGTCG